MRNLDSIQVCQAIREEYRQDAERRGKQCPGGYWISANKNCGGSKTRKKVAAAGLVAGAVASGVLASKLMKKRKGTDQKMLPGSTGQKALPGSTGRKALPGGGTPQPIGGGGPQPRLGPASVARASFKETARKREMAS